jgi:hypothetical protein
MLHIHIARKKRVLSHFYASSCGDRKINIQIIGRNRKWNWNVSVPQFFKLQLFHNCGLFYYLSRKNHLKFHKKITVNRGGFAQCEVKLHRA